MFEETVATIVMVILLTLLVVALAGAAFFIYELIADIIRIKGMGR